MKRLAYLFLTVVTVTAVTVAAATPIQAQPVNEALTRLEEDGFTGDRFTFCVLGDTRHWTPIVMPEAFLKNIREMNLLDPSFIIDIGDLIVGYTYEVPLAGYTEEGLIHAEWDEFLATIATSRVPFIPVVGNHDVWDWRSQRIFKERVGPVTFSFDYGNSHFVCLTTEEPGHRNYITLPQLHWLEADLAAHRQATNIFVFMHEPIWGYSHIGSNWLSDVQPLLLKYPVKAVFASHEHIYRKDVVDGIPCFVTGGGGAELGGGAKGGAQNPGAFHHFLHVSVKGDQMHIAVVKTGNIESEDVVTGQAIETTQLSNPTYKPLRSQQGEIE